MKLERWLARVAVIGMAACGGGGGGGGSDVPSRDACSLLKPKILTGTACSDESRYPIARLSLDGTVATEICSGTLIAPRFVLTAGHCVPPIGNLVAFASFGDLTFPVVRTVRHPLYTEPPGINEVFFDVGVVELSADVPIQPLPLAASRIPVAGDIISIFGYGVDDNQVPGQLRSGQMRVTQVTPDHVFALYTSDGSNTCAGDSGGPATIEIDGEQALAGVTSSGTTEGCVIGDNSSFANVENPQIVSFLQTEVTGGFSTR